MNNGIFRVTARWMVSLLVLCSQKSSAAEVPKSPQQLRETATHIVTGKVTNIECRSRYSQIEVGSFDYAIECSIAVETVEKGAGIKPGDNLVANCFRPKTRLGLMQSLSLQGHSPVPARGQQVRAHLVNREGQYFAIHPNGFAPTEGGVLREAEELTQFGRWSPPFTFLLPLELWALIAAVVLLAAVVPKPYFKKAFKWLLLVAATLSITGLIVGLLGFLCVI